jgi:peptidoglycan/LPS O-acetylase OafA/YrhL
MLGSFRLLLALLVALSHAGLRMDGLNPGVSAVVGFYLVSGYVMTGLLRRHYPTLALAPRFYLDRALRLYPQYLAIAALTLLWFAATDARNDFLRHAPDALDLLNNLLIAPLNYLYASHDAYALIPPAWSLGAEVQFYLLFPLILLARAGRPLLLALSLLLYLAAAWGLLPTEPYGYRFLPGVLFIFLLGSWLYDLHAADRRPAAVALTVATLLGSALLALLLQQNGSLHAPYNRETLLGLALGLPALALLGPLKRQIWDEALGDLSYGVFLVHFLILWTVIDPQGNAQKIGLYLALSCLAAFIAQRLIEKPALALRHRLRPHRQRCC